MNSRYLGDALDHWKGSLFEYLQSQRALTDFAVDPMITDPDQWQEADFCVLARLLHIKSDQIIRHKKPLSSARVSYFHEIPHRGDLFLDPDTGIATGRASEIEKYVTPSELKSLLRASGRAVAVYQHVSRQKTCERVDACLDVISREVDSFGWCSYESASVAMLFLCDDEARTRTIDNVLNQLLGGRASKRVRSGLKTLEICEANAGSPRTVRL